MTNKRTTKNAPADAGADDVPKKIWDQLLEEAVRKILRPRYMAASHGCAFLIGGILTLVSTSVPGFWGWVAFVLFCIVPFVVGVVGFRYRRIFDELTGPDWADRVRQLRLHDDAPPLVVAAIALEEAAAAKQRTADARHSETREMKDEVIAWWEANKHTGITKDAAATEMAGKLVPLTFRTVRDYLKGI